MLPAHSTNIKRNFFSAVYSVLFYCSNVKVIKNEVHVDNFVMHICKFLANRDAKANPVRVYCGALCVELHSESRTLQASMRH
jgi:hypothetical protein